MEKDKNISNIDDNDVSTIKISTDAFTLFSVSTPCLICGEGVLCDVFSASPKICDKCKAVILKLREQEDKKE